MAFTIGFCSFRFQYIVYSFVTNYGLIWGHKKIANDMPESSSINNVNNNNIIISVLDTNPHSVESWQTQKVVIGYLYSQMKEYELAKNQWDDADLKPEFFTNKINDIQQLKSLIDIEHAILLSPQRSELLYYKGFFFEYHGDLKNAEKWYSLSEEYNNWENPDLSFEILYKHGEWLFINGEIEKSEAVLLATLNFQGQGRLDDSRRIAMVYRWLGLIAQEKGEVEKAQAFFECAIEQYPKDFWNYISLAVILERRSEDPHLVFQYFNKAMEISPYSLYAYMYPARHYMDRKQFGEWQYFCTQTPINLQRDALWLEICEAGN